MSIPRFDPFAELTQSQKIECSNGMSYLDLGKSAYNVFQKSQRLQTPELQEADMAPWECVAGKAASIVDLPEDELAEVNISARALAKTLYNQYTIEKDLVPDWESQPNQIAWEAVGRHMANLIDSDGVSVDFADMESRIVDWALERSSPTQLVLS